MDNKHDIFWIQFYTNKKVQCKTVLTFETKLSCTDDAEQHPWLYPLHTSSVQLLSRIRLFATPWTAAPQASLSITNSRSPPKPMSIESVMSSNHLILCRPLLLLPSIFPSIRVFSNESALCIRGPKYWSYSFSISPSNEHPGLILRMDWFDLLAGQGTLKSLLQHHSSKASILWRSAFFIVHPTLTSIYDHWKNHSLLIVKRIQTLPDVPGKPQLKNTGLEEHI